jgi:hypothetical protein
VQDSVYGVEATLASRLALHKADRSSLGDDGIDQVTGRLNQAEFEIQLSDLDQHEASPHRSIESGYCITSHEDPFHTVLVVLQYKTGLANAGPASIDTARGRMRGLKSLTCC